MRSNNRTCSQLLAAEAESIGVPGSKEGVKRTGPCGWTWLSTRIKESRRRGKRTKYQLVVRPLHSSQKWSWTEDLGMGGKANLEVIGARLEEQDCLLVIVSRTLNTACRYEIENLFMMRIWTKKERFWTHGKTVIQKEESKISLSRLGWRGVLCHAQGKRGWIYVEHL